MHNSFDDLPRSKDPALAAAGWRTLTVHEGPIYACPTGPLEIRAGGDGTAEGMIPTGPSAANAAGGLHGGFLASFAEQTLFLPLFIGGSVRRGGVVTVDFNLQYLRGGNTVSDVTAKVTLMHETGRLGFVRGVLEQDGLVIVSYTGTLRKVPVTR